MEFDLITEQEYTDFVHEFEDFIWHKDGAKILRYIEEYHEWLEQHPEFTQQYIKRAQTIEELFVEGHWMTLVALKPDRVVALFQKHLNSLFHLPEKYDLLPELETVKHVLFEDLRVHLTQTYLLDDRNALKKRINQALTSNQEIITSAKFYRGIKEAPATTKNWFSEYIEYIGDNHTAGWRKSFLSTNENMRRLSEADAQKITWLIELYERLRLSSWMMFGLEDQILLDDDIFPFGSVLQYGEFSFPSEQEQKETLERMKTYRDLLLDQGEEVPTSLQEAIGDGQVKRPPIYQFDKGALNIHMATGPDISATAGPDHFTAQDEEDMRKFTDQTDELRPTGSNVQQQAKRLIGQLQLNFVTPEQQKKFTMLLESVLRGLRDHMELSTYLQDMGYDQAEIDRILQTVKQAVHNGAISSGATSSRKTTSDASGQLPPSVVTAGAASRMKSGTASGAQDVSGDVSVSGAMPDIAMFNQTRPVSSSVSSPNTDTTKKSFLPKLRRSRRTKRPLVDDVKIQQSMVMGPIDELHAMDLVEFRRLSPDPVAAAGKLKDKITLLGQETIGKQAEGLQAFRESILNQMYIEIGNSSIASGRAVADVIAERQAQGQITLSLNEFNAIADLNKELRF